MYFHDRYTFYLRILFWWARTVMLAADLTLCFRKTWILSIKPIPKTIFRHSLRRSNKYPKTMKAWKTWARQSHPTISSPKTKIWNRNLHFLPYRSQRFRRTVRRKRIPKKMWMKQTFQKERILNVASASVGGAFIYLRDHQETLKFQTKDDNS